jgi:hypothetical protein
MCCLDQVHVLLDRVVGSVSICVLVGSGLGSIGLCCIGICTCPMISSFAYVLNQIDRVGQCCKRNVVLQVISNLKFRFGYELR